MRLNQIKSINWKWFLYKKLVKLKMICKFGLKHRRINGRIWPWTVLHCIAPWEVSCVQPTAWKISGYKNDLLSLWRNTEDGKINMGSLFLSGRYYGNSWHKKIKTCTDVK